MSSGKWPTHGTRVHGLCDGEATLFGQIGLSKKHRYSHDAISPSMNPFGASISPPAAHYNRVSTWYHEDLNRKERG